jgi:CDP-paratose 2-epimerase
MKKRNGNGRTQREQPVLITGGCGFVGTNLAHRLLSAGTPVRLLDDLSRPGVEQNLAWLQARHGSLVEVRENDVRDPGAVRRAVRGVSFVYHLAAQVAVTTSLADPVRDFEVNAMGTLNVLEAIRTSSEPPPLVYTSTNKVYGSLEDIALVAQKSRYQPRYAETRLHGVSEQRPLDFHSPYGCSKGTADQYVIDYARSYGLSTAVFRMSCIYGPHQFGTEDQGWVAHFALRAIEGEPITIFGDGRQVRDLLFVEDLVDAFELARRNIGSIRGAAFNIGGGAANGVSLLELLDLIRSIRGEAPAVEFEPWRVGDQRYYVSDTSFFGERTGWTQRTSVEQGLRRLFEWLAEARAPQPRAEVAMLRPVAPVPPTLAGERIGAAGK